MEALRIIIIRRIVRFKLKVNQRTKVELGVVLVIDLSGNAGNDATYKYLLYSNNVKCIDEWIFIYLLRCVLKL